MKLDELTWFIVLAETQHMTEASERLNVTQPTLSRALARWEHQLGVPLFDRVSRRLRLNANGQILLTHARRCGEELTAAAERIAALNDPDHGLVRLAFLHSAATWLVPDLLRRYRADVPAVQFELRQAASYEIVDALHDHHVDIGITSPRPDPAAFVWHPLSREQLCLAVPVGHRLAGRRAVLLREARTEPFIALPVEYGLRQLMDELWRAANVDPNIVFESSEISSMEGLVAAGLGVAIVPPPQPNRAGAGVVHVPLRDAGAHRVIGVTWRKTVPLPRVAARFAEFVTAPADDLGVVVE